LTRSLRTVRSRAPLRLGLAGGGTDLPEYCRRFGGAVLNATIDRFAYAFVSTRVDGLLVFRARDRNREERFKAAAKIPDSQLPLHRGVYERFVRDFNDGKAFAATITTTVDAPADSGLGASSALVVALLGALQAYKNLPWDAYEAARLAVQIERVDLGLPGGQQDHYAAAFGGANFIEFRPGGDVIVDPLRIPGEARNELEASLVICFVGGGRDATNIIREQNSYVAAESPIVIEAFHRLKEGAFAIRDAILLGDIPRTADILRESWSAKQLTATGVATEEIDRFCNIAAAHGAMAGKISGAGGGGFLMFVIPPEDRLGLITALNAAGGIAGPVKFTDRGCEAWQVRA
jgi:D-glycero-alpha-D-manno-heptose-7-phosphate kinase